jgi:murein DD-endopeptidase MepM/ murein hydrolase activator NlpD
MTKAIIQNYFRKFIIWLLGPLIPWIIGGIGVIVVLMLAVTLMQPASDLWTDNTMDSEYSQRVIQMADSGKSNFGLEELPPSYVFAYDVVNRGNIFNDKNLSFSNVNDLAPIISSPSVKSVDEICIVLDYEQLECSLFEESIELWNTLNIPIPKSGVGTYLLMPVSDPYVITAPFGSIDDAHSKPHSGVDFVPIGEDQFIYASADGIIHYAQATCPAVGYLGSQCPTDNEGYSNNMGQTGNGVVIKTNFDSQDAYIVYGHLATVLVSKGQEIKAGDIIGIVGNSGSSTGKHLHFALRMLENSNKYMTDPMPYITKERNDLAEPDDDKKQMMLQAGISERDLKWANYVISRDSNWDIYFNNKITGEYGLCTANEQGEIIQFGNDWRDNPVTQLKHCNWVAHKNYGSWEASYEIFKEKNSW